MKFDKCHNCNKKRNVDPFTGEIDETVFVCDRCVNFLPETLYGPF